MSTISSAVSDSAIAATLYARMEKRRKQLGLNQADMAERLAITPKSYRAIEQGRCKLVTFIALLRQLGLLENLENLVPEPVESPLASHKNSKARGAALKTTSLLANRRTLRTK